MKNDGAQRAASAPEAAEAAARAAGRVPVTPDEIVRFRILLEQTLATPPDETRDESAGEAAQAAHPGGLPRHGRGPFSADNGRHDVGGGPAASRTFPSDPFASAPYRAAAAQPDARRRASATQPDAEARLQETMPAGRPAAADVDLLRALVAEILFAVELPDRRHAIGLEMHSAVLPGTRICLTMNDDELSVLLQTRSEPVYRDALARRNALVQTLVQRCARTVLVEIEFDA